jgi:hypothetical protein
VAEASDENESGDEVKKKQKFGESFQKDHCSVPWGLRFGELFAAVCYRSSQIGQAFLGGRYRFRTRFARVMKKTGIGRL